MIKSIYNGAHVLDEKVFDKVTDLSAKQNQGFDDSIYRGRALDIIRAISEGVTNKQLSEKLFISEGTVKTHISTILEKGNLSHRTQLAVYYLTGKK